VHEKLNNCILQWELLFIGKNLLSSVFLHFCWYISIKMASNLFTNQTNKYF